MVFNGRGSPLHTTVSQTVGPYFHVGLKWLFNDRVADADVQGTHISVQGRVLDGDGVAVSDALIEVWQADSNGRYVHPEDTREGRIAAGFRGYARVPTDEQGSFRFMTVKPGAVPAPDGSLQAPHILVALFMRGLLRHLATRVYFAGEALNDDDLLLRRLPPSRRATLIASPRDGNPDVFEWNIALQGANETVFFDY